MLSGGGRWPAGVMPVEGHQAVVDTDWLHQGCTTQRRVSLHPWDTEKEDLSHNQTLTKPSSPNPNLLLPNRSLKLTLLGLAQKCFRKRDQKWRQFRWNTGSSQVKRTPNTLTAHWCHQKGILYGRILYNSLFKAGCLFYLLSSLQGASLLFCRDKPLTEATKYFWSMLMHRTRECVDRKKQFNCSPVAFLNPQPLTLKKSLTTVSTESTSITVLRKKNEKLKTRVLPFWKLAVHISALHLISFW